MRFRRISFPISALLSIIAILLYFFHGLNFGIDFLGEESHIVGVAAETLEQLASLLYRPAAERQVLYTPEAADAEGALSTGQPVVRPERISVDEAIAGEPLPVLAMLLDGLIERRGE